MAATDQPAPGHLAFHDVTCVRGGRMLFAALSFALAPGGAALVTGPNGAGKSSLIRIAAGLLRPAHGAVEGSARRALMAEAAALDPECRLGTALAFWAALDDEPAAGERVAAALIATGLAPLAEVPVRILSTGQRRRAQIARVIASAAPVWLLDEPGNGLDMASVGTLEALIATHRAGGGVVVVATHQAVALPDAVAVVL